MKVRDWKKVGEPKVLAAAYGKSFGIQRWERPDGKETDFVIMGHRNVAIILPITREGNVVMIREFKQGAEEVVNALPAGVADFEKEKPEDVAARELREETGYEAERIIPLGFHFMNDRSMETRVFGFVALGCTRVGEQHLDAEEEIEVVEVSATRWLAMTRNGEVTEPGAIVATFRAQEYLEGYNDRR